MNSLFNYQSLMYQEIFKFLNHKKVKINFLKYWKAFLSAVVLMSSATFANATNEYAPKINFEQVTNEKVRLRFENMNSSQSFLTILNDKSETVYYEVIKDETYSKIFDLHILEDGEYIISVEFDNKIIKQNATIKDNVLTLGLLETLAKPAFTIEGNTVSVYMSESKNAIIDVQIVDETGYVFYEKTEKIVDNFGKLYVLNELAQGEYVIHVTVNDIVYSKYVTVR